MSLAALKQNDIDVDDVPEDDCISLFSSQSPAHESCRKSNFPNNSMINHAKLNGNLQDSVPDSQSTVEEEKFEKASTSQRMPITMI